MIGKLTVLCASIRKLSGNINVREHFSQFHQLLSSKHLLILNAISGLFLLAVFMGAFIVSSRFVDLEKWWASSWSCLKTYMFTIHMTFVAIAAIFLRLLHSYHACCLLCFGMVSFVGWFHCWAGTMLFYVLWLCKRFSFGVLCCQAETLFKRIVTEHKQTLV